MDQDKRFIQVAGFAAILTFFTTIGVHYVQFSAETFDQRLQLIHHSGYLAHRWMIIVHCLLVITSMLGLALLMRKEGRGWMTLGFVFYVIFGAAEMARMFGVLQVLNGLRRQYLETTDEATQNLLQHSMEQFSLTGNALFSLFIFAFATANLCYGIAFAGSQGKKRWIGYAFLYWALTSYISLAQEYWPQPWLEGVHVFNGKVFQPVFRFILGAWMLRQASRYT